METRGMTRELLSSCVTLPVNTDTLLNCLEREEEGNGGRKKGGEEGRDGEKEGNKRKIGGSKMGKHEKEAVGSGFTSKCC